jgi:hypothetical protein
MLIQTKYGRLKFYLLSVVVSGIVGAGLVPDGIPYLNFIIGLLLWAVSIIPLFLWVRSGMRTIAMFPLISIFYGVQYGLCIFSQAPAIVIHSQETVLSWDSVLQAQIYSLLGLVAMQIGHWLACRQRLRVFSPIRLYVPPKRRFLLIFSLFSVGLIGVFMQATSWNDSLGGIGTFLRFNWLLIPAVLAIGLYSHRERGEERFLSKRWLWASVAGLIVFGLVTTTMLESVFISLLFVWVIIASRTRKVSLLLLVVTFFIVSLFNSVKMDVRQGSRSSEGTTVTALSKWSGAVAGADYTRLLFDRSEFGESAYWRELLSRFSLLNRFAWVCDNTPGRVPFFGGRSYMPFFHVWIPRIAWPDKPIMSDVTMELDFAYELRDATMGFSYSIGIGLISEAYANYGAGGVFIVALFIGAVLGLFGLLFNRPNSDCAAAIYAVCLSSFLNGLGSSAIIMFGNLAQVVICAALLIAPFSVSQSAGRTRDKCLTDNSVIRLRGEKDETVY